MEKEGGKLIFTEGDLWKSSPALSGTITFLVAAADSYFVPIQGKVIHYRISHNHPSLLRTYRSLGPLAASRYRQSPPY